MRSDFKEPLPISSPALELAFKALCISEQAVAYFSSCVVLGFSLVPSDLVQAKAFSLRFRLAQFSILTARSVENRLPPSQVGNELAFQSRQ